jgi:hypothetical protein
MHVDIRPSGKTRAVGRRHPHLAAAPRMTFFQDLRHGPCLAGWLRLCRVLGAADKTAWLGHEKGGKHQGLGDQITELPNSPATRDLRPRLLQGGTWYYRRGLPLIGRHYE